MQVSFSAVEMLTLAQPAWISSVNCWGLRPDPPCSACGMPVASWICLTRSASRGGAGGVGRVVDVAAPVGVGGGGRTVSTVGVADRRGKDVDSGSFDEIDGDGKRLGFGDGVGADAVFHAGDRFDLAFDLGAVGTGLGDHLDGLAEVLLDGQGGCVEEYAVPAAS